MYSRAVGSAFSSSNRWREAKVSPAQSLSSTGRLTSDCNGESTVAITLRTVSR